MRLRIDDRAACRCLVNMMISNIRTQHVLSENPLVGGASVAGQMVSPTIREINGFPS